MSGILLLFLSWGLTAAAQPPVLSPRIGVAIADADVLRSRKLKPALMATDGQNLYISSQSEIDGCAGQGLYRIALGGTNSLAIEEIPLQRGGQPLPHPVCVQRLQVFSEFLSC